MKTATTTATFASRIGLPGCLVASLMAACTASGGDVEPPRDQLSYPTGMALSPDGSHLFVANANSELRYDSGTISVVQLDTVDTVATAWTSSQTIPAGCTRDSSQSATLVCDEAMFLAASSGVRIGNFATALALQDTGSGNARLITAVRGDPSITWVDWNGETLSCSEGTGGFSLCDDEHRLTELSLGIAEIEPVPLPAEPFQVYVNSQAGFGVVTHLTSGTTTLIDLPTDASPYLSDRLTGMFSPNALTGAVGAAAVAGRTPNATSDLIYVTSRSDDRVVQLTVARDDNAPYPYLVPTSQFFLDAVGGNNGFSLDARAAAFSADGNRLYIVNRAPPSLQVYDSSIDPQTAMPRNRGLAATDLCRGAANLAIGDVGDGDRGFVTCFSTGEIYIVDPRGLASVEAIVTVGRGPFGVVFSATRKKLYVSNFLEDTIAVIELDPLSPQRYQVVLRVGEVRQ